MFIDPCRSVDELEILQATMGITIAYINNDVNGGVNVPEIMEKIHAKLMELFDHPTYQDTSKKAVETTEEERRAELNALDTAEVLLNHWLKKSPDCKKGIDSMKKHIQEERNKLE